MRMITQRAAKNFAKRVLSEMRAELESQNAYKTAQIAPKTACSGKVEEIPTSTVKGA